MKTFEVYKKGSKWRVDVTSVGSNWRIGTPFKNKRKALVYLEQVTDREIEKGNDEYNVVVYKSDGRLDYTENCLIISLSNTQEEHTHG